MTFKKGNLDAWKPVWDNPGPGRLVLEGTKTTIEYTPVPHPDYPFKLTSCGATGTWTVQCETLLGAKQRAERRIREMKEMGL